MRRVEQVKSVIALLSNGLVLLTSAFLLLGCGSILPVKPTPTLLPSLLPSVTVTVTRTATATWTATPTLAPTATSTPTPTPVLAGTPLGIPLEPISEVNLPRLAELSRWGRGQVNDLLWGPNALYIATDLGVYQYDPVSLTLQRVIDSQPVKKLALAPAGDKLICAGQTWAQWNLLDGSSQALAEKGAPLALGFTLDGADLVSLAQPENRSAELNSRATKARIPLAGQVGPLAGAIFSRDLTFLAGWGQYGSLSVWRIDGSKLFDLPASEVQLGPVAFSPDSTTFAVAYPDETIDFRNTNKVVVYKLPEGKPLYELAPYGGVEGASERIVSLTYSMQGDRIAVGYANNTVRLFPTQPAKPPRQLSGNGIPFALAFSPAGDRLASAALDLWDSHSAKLIASVPEHRPPVQDFVLSPDGEMAALAEFGRVELRRVSDGSLIRSIEDIPAIVNGLSFSPDGHLLAGACADGTARLWRVRDGRYLTLMAPPTRPLWSTAFSTDGKDILISGENGLIQRYEIEKDAVTLAVREPYLAVRLVYSPVGTLYGVLTSDGANIRDVQGTLTRHVAGIGLEDLAFSVDGGALALAGNQVLRVIDVGSGKDLYASYDPKRGSPSAVAYSPDGAFLAVGRSDGQIDILWAADGSLLRTLEGHRGKVKHLAFTSGNLRLLSSGEDGTIRVWGITP